MKRRRVFESKGEVDNLLMVLKSNVVRYARTIKKSIYGFIRGILFLFIGTIIRIIRSNAVVKRVTLRIVSCFPRLETELKALVYVEMPHKSENNLSKLLSAVFFPFLRVVRLFRYHGVRSKRTIEPSRFQIKRISWRENEENDIFDFEEKINQWRLRKRINNE